MARRPMRRPNRLSLLCCPIESENAKQQPCVPFWEFWEITGNRNDLHQSGTIDSIEARMDIGCRQNALHPRSLITADGTDLLTDVHWNQSIPIQHSDVHDTNASTCEYAHKASSADDEIMYTSQHTDASSDSAHKPCDQRGLEQNAALRCAEHHREHKWVTVAVYGGTCKKHQSAKHSAAHALMLCISERVRNRYML